MLHSQYCKHHLHYACEICQREKDSHKTQSNGITATLVLPHRRIQVMTHVASPCPVTFVGSLRGPALRQAEDLLRLVQQAGAAGHLVACMQEAGVDARGSGVWPVIVRCNVSGLGGHSVFLLCLVLPGSASVASRSSTGRLAKSWMSHLETRSIQPNLPLISV